MKRVLQSRRSDLVLAAMVVAVFFGSAIPGGAEPLAPATFDEYVGIAWYSSAGTNLLVAESVDLGVTLGQTGNRGGGTGFARATAVLPVLTEAGLNLFGGANQSGIGGTAAVQTRYQFAVEPLAPGLPQTVPVILSASGFVSVHTNGSPVGWTFARIDHPGGQWQASNSDPWGSYSGEFSFDETATLQLSANTPQTISIYVYSHGQAFGPDFGPDFYYDSRTLLDPVVEIHPEFPDRDQFRIVYSEGILPVPVPSSVWLLTSGVLSLAGFRKLWGKKDLPKTNP